ncbi:MAG TPA: GNAT family N-acetyltransferase [Solirubrobacteraceae bacterium]|nr:GNAT family N-acetyltransferase [Solirubrobacteraceae bacterium]
MGEPAELKTSRLLLRRWREQDRAPFAAMNADAKVMRHFPSPLTAGESDALVSDLQAHFERHGFGLWALQSRSSHELLGFTGLCFVSFDAHFTPAVEVGWRLRRSAWGHGYASEAALAALRFGFAELGVREIVSFTSTVNERSRAVMERIGMARDAAGDFAHPLIARDSPLAPHVLYRLSAADWRARRER